MGCNFKTGASTKAAITFLMTMGAYLMTAAAAHASIDFVFTTGDPVTGQQSMASDSNKCPTDGPLASYVGGSVTNSGPTTVNGITATINGLSGSFALAGAQSPTLELGSLAPGDDIMVAWLVAYPCDTSKKNGVPPATGGLITLTDDTSATSTQALTLTARKAISANAGGQVLSTTLGEGAIIGQTIVADILYDFGGNSIDDEFFVQPAGNTDFDAACLRLIGTEITSSNITSVPVGTENTLYFVSSTSQSGNGYFIGVRYFFRYLCANTTSTARPYSIQTSGNTNIKYTGNYDGVGALTFDFPTSTNPLVVTKTATPSLITSETIGTTAQFTVTVENPSAFDTMIDSFSDTLPSGVTYDVLDGVSEVNAGNSAVLPATGDSGTLSFIGLTGTSYSVPAGSSVSLIYDAVIPEADGTYINTASAKIGDVIIGSDQATVTVAGGKLDASKSVSVYDPDALNLYAIPGNDVVYTFNISNVGTGAVDAGSVILTDKLPEDLTIYTGDFDPNVPGMGPVSFDEGSSGLTCCLAAGEVEYSDSTTEPPVYGYVPTGGYDPNVTHIKITPSNAFAAGSSISASFRMRIE